MIFNGSDYQPRRDNTRLMHQHKLVFDLMKDAKWRSLKDIEYLIKQPQASISAQLRHLRKSRFGGHTLNKRYVNNGLYEYQLIVNESYK